MKRKPEKQCIEPSIYQKFASGVGTLELLKSTWIWPEFWRKETASPTMPLLTTKRPSTATESQEAIVPKK